MHGIQAAPRRTTVILTVALCEGLSGVLLLVCIFAAVALWTRRRRRSGGERLSTDDFARVCALLVELAILF